VTQSQPIIYKQPRIRTTNPKKIGFQKFILSIGLLFDVEKFAELNN